MLNHRAPTHFICCASLLVTSTVLGACGQSDRNPASEDPVTGDNVAGSGGTSGSTTGNDAASTIGDSSSGATATTSATPPNLCDPIVTLLDHESLLADFEDAISTQAYSLQTAVKGGAYAYYDETDPNSEFAFEIIEPGHESNRALAVQVTEAKTWGAGMGLWFRCLDASGFAGFTFWMRGVAPSGVVEVSIGSPAVDPVSDGGTCPDDSVCTNPIAMAELSEDWTQVSLKWSDFADGMNGDQQVPATGSDLTGINIHIVHDFGPASDLELVVDDFQFLTVAK